MSLRDVAARGFKSEFDGSDGAILLHLAGLFYALPVDQESESDRAMLKRLRRERVERACVCLSWTWR